MTAHDSAADRNTRALAALRIAIGILFLIFGEYKVFGREFTRGGGFQHWINGFISEGCYPFMLPVLKNFVLPRAAFFAFLTAYGELAVGLGLTLGVLVRAASMGGLLLMLAILFSSSYPGPSATFWQYFGASLSQSILALCFSAFLVGDAARAYSLPAYLRSRRAAR